MRTKNQYKKKVEPGERFCEGCKTMHDNEMFYAPNRKNCKQIENDRRKKRYAEKRDAFAAFF
jgi:hypothetical protein